MKVHWTTTALRDLAALHEYIALDNVDAAIATTETMVNGIQTLARHPEMGRKGRISGTCELVFAPFIAVYRVRRERVELVAIIHGSRKWPDFL